MTVTQIPIDLSDDFLSANFLVILALLFSLFFIKATDQIPVFFGDGLITHKYPHIVQQAEGVILIEIFLYLLFLRF